MYKKADLEKYLDSKLTSKTEKQFRLVFMLGIWASYLKLQFHGLKLKIRPGKHFFRVQRIIFNQNCVYQLFLEFADRSFK